MLKLKVCQPSSTSFFLKVGNTCLTVWVQWVLFFLYAAILLIGQIFIVREQFYVLLTWQIILHGLYVFFFANKETISLKNIITVAIICRVVCLFTAPTLSDDVYRFIWDGKLIATAQNPLLTTPNAYLAALPTTSENYAYYKQLHGLVNHPQNFTCYPPLMQGMFYVSAIIGGNNIAVSIFVLKCMLGFIDIIGIYFLIKILQKLQINVKNILLYALSPMVIIEGTGNVHFEVVQVAFIAASIYVAMHKKLWQAALLWGLAIVTKLLPLLLLPLWIRYLGFKKGLVFCVISVGFTLLLFMPFVSVASIKGFSESLNLYFQHFEFNASIYYIARQIGWWAVGYNYISFIGPFLMVVFLGLYSFIFFKKRTLSLQSFAHMALVVLSLYYFLATTVHPWYIINLLPFALIANKKYAFVWMGMAFLSYCAYSNAAFRENFYTVFVEYFVVAMAIYYSYKKTNLTDG